MLLWVGANRAPGKPEPGNCCSDCFLLSQGAEWGQPPRGRAEDLREGVLVLTCEKQETPGAPAQLGEEPPGIECLPSGRWGGPSAGATVGRKMILISSAHLGVPRVCSYLISSRVWGWQWGLLAGKEIL